MIVVMYECHVDFRSFANNWGIYKLLAYQKPAQVTVKLKTYQQNSGIVGTVNMIRTSQMFFNRFKDTLCFWELF